MAKKDTGYSSWDSLDDDSSSSKQESTERFLLLIRMLTANVCTRKDVFGHLSVYYKIDTSNEETLAASHRQANRIFERDIKFLDELGYEIEKNLTAEDKRVIRYHIVPGTGPGTQFLFTQSELDTLIVIYSLFTDPTKNVQSQAAQLLPAQPSRHPFSEQVLALIERFVALLPEKQRIQFDQSVRKPYIYFNIAPVTDYLPHRVIIDFIVTAIADRRSISFLYSSSRGKKTPTPHERVDPYYITHIDGHFYLIGYSYRTENFYEYRIDRIIEESLERQPYSIDLTRQRNPIEFRYWADEDLVHGGLSQRWLSQSVERDEEYIDENNRKRRRFLVRATDYSEWRIRQQLRRYANKVELIEPQYLRDLMRHDLQQTLSPYLNN